ISPLQAMATQASLYCKEHSFHQQALFCPMIDAGRMEVYAAIYNQLGQEIRAVQADIVDTQIYAEYLNQHELIFIGNGSSKCKETLANCKNAVFFEDFHTSAAYMLSLGLEAYNKKDFVNLAYFEPFYLKDFIAGKSIVKGLHS
ncbi:MAG: tRNA (adenosine(37)-N6)-threonylcarbamoyltransferase complex dimerization subunit type 1 TsaB, partial [Bacteroidales bacterium]